MEVRLWHKLHLDFLLIILLNLRLVLIIIERVVVGADLALIIDSQRLVKIGIKQRLNVEGINLEQSHFNLVNQKMAFIQMVKQLI